MVEPPKGLREGRFQIIDLKKSDTAATISAADDSGERARGQYSRNGGLGVIGGLEASRPEWRFAGFASSYR